MITHGPNCINLYYNNLVSSIIILRIPIGIVPTQVISNEYRNGMLYCDHLISAISWTGTQQQFKTYSFLVIPIEKYTGCSHKGGDVNKEMALMY